MSSQNYKHFSKAGYPRPKNNILVISCIDLRLTDNLMKFLSAENLENRYDLVTLAGASLCGANDETVSKEFRKKYKEA